MADLARARIRVRGLVQGVAFRQSTVDQARRLGLEGWVRNRADGSVEAEAQGARARVEALVAWCRRGPPAAEVEGVEVEWIAPSEALGSFRVTS
ncbi:MAG TPA: acylphosphatase [Anaeromyxobacteraceae bacterium]|nr:acylphosphatase [Anaeromyxobacteraceae bacterium]